MWIVALKWPTYVGEVVEVVLARRLRATIVVLRVTINLASVELWRPSHPLQFLCLELPAAQNSGLT